MSRLKGSKNKPKELVRCGMCKQLKDIKVVKHRHVIIKSINTQVTSKDMYCDECWTDSLKAELEK